MSSEGILSFVAGLLFCALINGVFMRDSIVLPNLEQVEITISKCHNSEYKSIKIKSLNGSSTHGYTIVECTDGTIVERMAFE